MYCNRLWFPLQKCPLETDYNTEGFSRWNPKQTRPLKRRQDIVKTRRLEVLTWDALVIIHSHTGFTRKIINLMLSLQRTGIKLNTKDNTGYYVRSPIQEVTPANFYEKHKHAANFHIWLQRHSSEFIAWSATGIPRRKQENRVKASELEFDELRDESRRTKMIIFINSHDNQKSQFFNSPIYFPAWDLCERYLVCECIPKHRRCLLPIRSHFSQL